MPNEKSGTTAAEGKNADLAALHGELLALIIKLEAAVDDAPDGSTVRELDRHIMEVTARATEVGRLLFARQTDEIASSAASVSAAIPSVETALEHLADMAAVTTSMTAVLALVDKAAETARECM